MRVALVTNVLEHRNRGNHTTIARWMAHVRGVGIRGVDADPDQELDPVPDVVHGYHALHGGVAARALARRYGLPLVVSLGGTDLYACLKGDATVTTVLQGADRVTGAFASFGSMLCETLRTDVPYVVVPRGIVVPDDVPPHAWDGKLHVLLPAGLRPAKDPLLALDLAERLVARGLPVTLRILGPEMNVDTARRVRERATGLPFPVEYGESEPEAMADAYAAADVVWNTSTFEGGANALLEAAAHGCAVFARDIPGNRELLADSPLGTLFDADDSDAAEAFHRALLDESEPERRERLPPQDHHRTPSRPPRAGRRVPFASRLHPVTSRPRFPPRLALEVRTKRPEVQRAAPDV